MDNRQDFVFQVPLFQIVPDADREDRWVDSKMGRPFTDLGIVCEVEGPHLGSVLAVENEE